MRLIQAVALSFLLTVGFQVSAKTINPADLVVDGGYSQYAGKAETTQLFVDLADNGARLNFWVKVTVNPGTFVPVDNSEPPAQEPVKTYIKAFPMSRYLAVLKQLKNIHRFGVVNPYIDDYVICDGPNSTIRRDNRKVIMAYNCGTDRRDADTATFITETLIKALRDETLQNADMQGVVPTQT